jgi:tRNA pseudouridine38-40 synthase
MSKNILAYLSYDGTNFFGWQVQPTVRTVQGEIIKALKIVFKKDISMGAAGRTDAGVHAKKQAITFKCPNDRMDESDIKAALNANLPDDIYISNVIEVPPSIHARYSAIKRIYHFYLYTGSDMNLFKRRYVWWYPHTLNLDSMRRACKYFEGDHDFKSYQYGFESDKTFRSLYRFRILKKGNLVIFRIEARSFLRKMIRNMVGTLVQVGLGSMEPDFIKETIDIDERVKIGPPAPGQGLCLHDVIYDL